MFKHIFKKYSFYYENEIGRKDNNTDELEMSKFFICIFLGVGVIFLLKNIKLFKCKSCKSELWQLHFINNSTFNCKYSYILGDNIPDENFYLLH